MRITAAGNVGIGFSNPTDKLMVAGIISPVADNTYSLGSSQCPLGKCMVCNGTIQTSDARLKTNIKMLCYGIKEVMQMNPVSYNWKTDPDGKARLA